MQAGAVRTALSPADAAYIKLYRFLRIGAARIEDVYPRAAARRRSMTFGGIHAQPDH